MTGSAGRADRFIGVSSIYLRGGPGGETRGIAVRPKAGGFILEAFVGPRRLQDASKTALNF